MSEARPPDERFARYRDTGDVTLRDQLIEDHLWIASHVARRFMDRGEPLDDLIQVARLGLVKALARFDPDHGSSFPAYAMPSVLGEVRRHFRDATWSLKVTRRAKELSLEVTKVTNELSHELGRSPRIAEIARASRFPKISCSTRSTHPPPTAHSPSPAPAGEVTVTTTARHPTTARCSATKTNSSRRLLNASL